MATVLAISVALYLIAGVIAASTGRFRRFIQFTEDGFRWNHVERRYLAGRSPSWLALFRFRAALRVRCVCLWPFVSPKPKIYVWPYVAWHDGPTALRRALEDSWNAPDEYFLEAEVPGKERAATGWSIGLSQTFLASVAKLDKKLQGRILEALTRLCSTPLTPYGDTVKPLEGDLKGLWRYRIGDYRLIYMADVSTKKVLLVEFAARGNAYRVAA